MRFAAALICLTSLVVGSVALSQNIASSEQSKPPAVAKSAAATANKPLWKDLSAAEQTALRPLAVNWDAMGVGQKRKWQSVAKDFDKLPRAQQAKMHTRMNEWITLSPQQRAEARINFAENRQLTDGLTPEQRKVQWQAYQQLSPDDRRKLAESAPKTSVAGAAPAAKPQPVLKKEPAPEFGTGKVLGQAQAASSVPAPGKKITVAPHVANLGSILPGTASEAAGKQ